MEAIDSKCWTSRMAKACERMSTPTSMFFNCAASVKFAEETSDRWESVVS